MKVSSYMKAQRYLGSPHSIKREIAQLQESKQYFLERASSITVPVDRIKVQTSTTADMVGDGVTNARSLDEEIDRLYSVLWKRENNIMKMILHMHDVNYMQVLFKVYIQGKTIKQASQEMGRSYYFVLDVHKKALAEFDKRYSSFLHGKKKEVEENEIL